MWKEKRLQTSVGFVRRFFFFKSFLFFLVFPIVPHSALGSQSGSGISIVVVSAVDTFVVVVVVVVVSSAVVPVFVGGAVAAALEGEERGEEGEFSVPP